MAILAGHIRWNVRRHPLIRTYGALSAKHKNVPSVQSRRVQLVRDFIGDCLYNPETGYFSKNVNIFDTGNDTSIDFSLLKDQEAYTWKLNELYQKQSREDEEYYQLWHTPSELFKPWYGHGIAKFMLHQHRKDEELVIYEVGPGNGTLAKCLLDYLRDNEPGVYEKTRYNLVEISPILSALQQKKLADHQDRTMFHQCSVLDLQVNDQQSRPFVMAMEVLDNMPHDRIGYDSDGTLLQGNVITDDSVTSLQAFPGKYSEEFVHVQDKLILDYMSVLDRLGRRSPSLNWRPSVLLDPFMRTRNPYRSEFIPTIAFQFLRKICSEFPDHRLILSDFSGLPDTMKGYGGPVVQTRYKGDTVACSTYLLQPGLFDIFFPTDFKLLKDVHQLLGKRSDGQVLSHAEFCKKWAPTEKTRTRSGYNPMLEEFQNVHFYLSSLLPRR